MLPVFAACLLAKTFQTDADARLAELLANLESPSPVARSEAVRTIVKLDLTTDWPGEEDVLRFQKIGTSPQRQQMTAALLKAAKDPNIAVRNEAIRALTVILRPRQGGVHGEPWQEESVIQPMIALGPAVILPLLDLLRNEVPRHSPPGLYNARLTAYQVLLGFKDPRILEFILPRIRHDPMSFPLAWMMDAAAEYDDPRVAESLIPRMHETLPGFDEPARTAVEKMGKRAVPALVRSLESGAPLHVRISALFRLWGGGFEEAREPLRRALNDPAWEIHARAFYALQALGWMSPEESLIARVKSDMLLHLEPIPPERLPELLALLKNPSPLVRSRAAHALAELDLRTEWPSEGQADLYESPRPGPERASMTAALLQTAKDPNIAVRNEAIRSLAFILRPRSSGMHGDPVLVPEDVDPLVGLGPSIVPILVEMLRTSVARGGENVHVADYAAVLALDRFKDRRIFEVLLLRIRQDEMSHRVGLMMQVAARYGDPRLVPALIDRLDEPLPDYAPPARWVLIEMGDRGLVALIEAMEHHPRPRVRRSAASALMMARNEKARPALTRALEDPDPILRAIAKNALDYLDDAAPTAP